MPLARCREYDDDGRPVRLGCTRRDCQFVHPKDAVWSIAQRRHPVVGQGRGRGSGPGGPPTGPTGPRDRSTGSSMTGSNTIPRGGGTGSNVGSDSGWNSRASTSGGNNISWGSWGNWGQDTTKGEESSTVKEPVSKGLGNSEDSAQDTGASKDKGKGKATESSWGWGAMDVDKDDTGWGWNASSAESPKWGGASPKWWGVSSPKATNTGWNAARSNDGVDKKETTSQPSVDERRDNITGVATETAKPDNVGILPAELISKTNVDSSHAPVPSPSVASLTLSKPALTGPSSLIAQQITPDVPMSARTSRSGSLIPVVPPRAEPRETRSFRGVTHKEARSVWNEYIELIRRSIVTRIRLTETRTLYKDYKTAQNSHIYIKAGKKGTIILDENIRSLKTQLDRHEKNYKRALADLCAFEEEFDFPLHLLMLRRADVRRMREESVILREYVREAKSCVENMRVTADDIESRARAVIAPAAPSSADVKDDLQKTQAELEPARMSLKDEIEMQLAALKEKAADLYHSFLDVRDNSNANELIQETLDKMKESLQTLMETETYGFSERISKVEEGLASIGRDLDKLCGHVVELLTSFKRAEMAAEEEILRLRASLEEDRQFLAASEANAQACQDLLKVSTGHLEGLRQELRTSGEAQTRTPKLQDDQVIPAAIPEELLDQLVAALLPIIRERLYPDVDTALKDMTESAKEFVQEHNKTQVQALSTALAPVYEVSGHLYAMIDPKKHANTMPPAHVGEARTQLHVGQRHT